MANSIVPGFEFQKGVQQAAVARIDLGRADEPLAGIAVPGQQTADQHEIGQQIDLAANPWLRYAKTGKAAAHPDLID